MTVAVILIAVIAAGLLLLFIKRTQEVNKFKNQIAQRTEELENYKAQYKDIIDVDKALATKNDELKKINQNIDTLKADYYKQKEKLNLDFKDKRNIYDNLLKEISILEENLENISYGLYNPHYDYKTSEEFKQKLEEIRDRQKKVIKDEKATFCPVKWEVGGSKTEGAKMTKHYSKLMLRAFNGECDAAIAKVSWSNIGNMEARIEKAYESINKLGSTHQINITSEYMGLSVDELRLEFELQEKLYQEKEEQRKIREQMREEEKALREIEKAKQDAEEEEERYQEALEKAKAEINKTTGKELDTLNERIKQLEENLQKAQEQKERAISRAELTKSGHVYIISNIGSFGDQVYKIGMTRRLEPLDRINELGDASVPFDFDVHGLIYSENAPELENILHKRLEDRRINLVNLRAEFFNVTIDEIEKIVNELNLTIQLTKIAEAKEYRVTQSIREAKKKQVIGHASQEEEKKLDKFPTTLD